MKPMLFFAIVMILAVVFSGALNCPTPEFGILSGIFLLCVLIDGTPSAHGWPAEYVVEGPIRRL